MGFSINIGKINKRVNSTSKTFDSVTTFSDCVLKEACDIKNPVVQVKGSANNYNYMEWNGRFYWVDKIIPLPNGIIEVSAHMDPLATYQADIKNTSAFISYSYNIISPEVVDPRMSPEIVMSKYNTNADSIFNSSPTPTSGSVIVTCFEAGLGSANQGVRTYAMTVADFMEMIQNITVSLYDHNYDVLNNNTDINNNLPRFTTPDDIANMIGALGSVAIYDVLKFLSDFMGKIGGYGSWRDNLLKAVYVPVDISDIPANGTAKNIYLGFLNTQKSAKVTYPAYVKTKSSTIAIPWDPHVVLYHWLKDSRFSQLQAICCGGQTAAIDTNLIKDLAPSDTLGIYTAIDVCSGNWSAALTKESSSNSLRLAAFGGDLGIDITGYAGKGGLGAGMNITQGAMKIAGSALSMGLSNNMESSMGESAASIGTGIASQFISNNCGNVGSLNCGNGISSIFMNGSTGFNDLTLVAQCTIPTMVDNSQYDSYCAEYGYPCNQYKSLSDAWGGFCKCEGASVTTKGNQQEQAYINSVLNSGIFLED